MNRWVMFVPSLLLFEASAPAPVSVEGYLLRLLEQLPMVAVIVWLWLRDSKRRDEAQEASDKRYESLVGVVIEELKKRPPCPLASEREEVGVKGKH